MPVVELTTKEGMILGDVAEKLGEVEQIIGAEKIQGVQE